MFKKVLIASTMLVSVVSANAIGFGVTGVIAPAPCNVTLTGNGLADFGTLTAPTVQGYTVDRGHYVMGYKDLNYSVVCNAPTKVAFSFVDAQAGKFIPFDGNDAIRFGVVDGAAGTTGIGHYEMRVLTAQVDNAGAFTTLGTVTGGTAWSGTGPTGLPSTFILPGHTVGFTKTSAATTPDALTTVTGDMQFLTRISKPYVDAATGSITLNGSGTMALVYL